MKYMAACSFGKDSIATVILAKEHNEPLDEVVYCEVMFDDEISGEVPEHRQFIYETAKPIFESWGIKVTILRSQKTYVSNFKHVIAKGDQAGKYGRSRFVDAVRSKGIANYHRSINTKGRWATTLFNI